ncbi:hypothetical protein Tco_1009457 [Tanacetum coccineum]
MIDQVKHEANREVEIQTSLANIIEEIIKNSKGRQTIIETLEKVKDSDLSSKAKAFLINSQVAVDGDLGPQEAIIYPGIALYHVIDGYVCMTTCMGGVSFLLKVMPESSLNCLEMRFAVHGFEAQFWLTVSVDIFMQRSRLLDQLLNINNFPSFSFTKAQEGNRKF